MSNTVTVTDSILVSLKKQLNIDKDYKAFDQDIVMLANSSFSVMTQLGIGPSEGFSITDESSVWGDFIQDDRLKMVFEDMYLRIRLVFDPPNGSVLSYLKDTINELDWRLTVASEEVAKENE